MSNTHYIIFYLLDVCIFKKFACPVLELRNVFFECANLLNFPWPIRSITVISEIILFHLYKIIKSQNTLCLIL